MISVFSYRIVSGIILLLSVILNISCRDDIQTVKSLHRFAEPIYGDIGFISQGDSLHFPLSETTYNDIRSFNYIINQKKPYLCFYDRRSESISIYEFNSQRRVKKIRLKKIFPDNSFYKTSVYVKNFDSIFVTNRNVLYLIDSSGQLKSEMSFSKQNEAMAFFENTVPAIFKGSRVYAGVRPSVNETSFSSLRNWRVIHEFDLNSKSKNLYYSLPEMYLTDIYGDNFITNSYCSNDKGNFVFSFSADTCIYESDLENYHIAYYGKSKFQDEKITPVSAQALRNDEGAKEFLNRFSYGAIFYDPYRKRYLRLARQKMSLSEIASGSPKKKESVIIFDKDFKIIGESELSDEFSFKTLFFTEDGRIYGRINRNDEYAIHFVRLEYLENRADSSGGQKKILSDP